MIDFGQVTALIGGSFDPVHEGHLHLAQELRRLRPEIRQIVFVPAAHSPGKSPALASPPDRLRWLRASAEPLGFRVWDWEIEQGGESFTVRTLEKARQLGARRERLFLTLGSDAYSGFSSWREPGKIRSLARLLVVTRPGFLLAPQDPLDLPLEILPHPASSRELRRELAAGRIPAALPPALREELRSSPSPYRQA